MSTVPEQLRELAAQLLTLARKLETPGGPYDDPSTPPGFEGDMMTDAEEHLQLHPGGE